MTDKVLRFEDPARWRRWLEENHGEAPEALVLISKKATPGGVHYLEALEEALCYGWIDGKLRAHDDACFVLRFSPRKAESVWSESNRDRAERLMREGRMKPVGLARIEEARRSGTWATAVRPMRVPRMPSDLAAALRADPKAWANFRAWGNSYRSAYIRWVLDAKTAKTRARRIRRVVERSARNKRPGIEGP